MEFYFNELSLCEEKAISYDEITDLIELYRVGKKNGLHTCRIMSADSERLIRQINQMDNEQQKRNLKGFYYSFFQEPFENDKVESVQDEYYLHRWSCEGNECVGLAVSGILNSISLSIAEKHWCRPYVDIQCDDQIEVVRNAAREEDFLTHLGWLEEQKDVKLIPTELSFSEKSIKLREDHGIDVLQKFAERIIHCEYVIGIINSMPFNPNMRRFIKAVREDGLIEIVLPWTDKGNGMIVKTTGRTMRETKKIAEILKERYGGIS